MGRLVKMAHVLTKRSASCLSCSWQACAPTLAALVKIHVRENPSHVVHVTQATCTTYGWES